MDRRAPLFRFDPGWLWIAAGLVIVFVATVVPAQRALEQDRADLRRLQAAERRVYRLLEAHDRFLADLRDGNESLLRRLAAANLNRMPAGDEAVLLADSIDRHPIAWIEASVPVETQTQPAGGRSLLELLVTESGGLWMTGAGILCLFVGLMLGPGPLRIRTSEASGEVDAVAGDEVGGELTADASGATDAEADRLRWSPAVATAVAASGALVGEVEEVTVGPMLWEDDVSSVEAEADEDAELEDEVEEDVEAEADEDAELEDEVEEDVEAEVEEDAELEDEVEEDVEAEVDEDAELEDEVEEDVEAEADEDAELEDEVEEGASADSLGPEIEVAEFSLDRSECDEFGREAWETSEFDVQRGD